MSSNGRLTRHAAVAFFISLGALLATGCSDSGFWPGRGAARQATVEGAKRPLGASKSRAGNSKQRPGLSRPLRNKRAENMTPQ